MGDSVDNLSRFPQPTQDVVTVDVDDHTECKHNNTFRHRQSSSGAPVQLHKTGKITWSKAPPTHHFVADSLALWAWFPG